MPHFQTDCVVPCSGVVCPAHLEQVPLPTPHIVLSLCFLCYKAVAQHFFPIVGRKAVLPFIVDTMGCSGYLGTAISWLGF